jgi:hypothetical protein
MTKTEMVIARKAEVAKSIDAAVKEVLALKAQYDEMEKQLKELKVETEAKFFQLPASVKERLEGEEYFLEKVPVLTKKEYDTKQLKVLLEAAGVDVKSVLTRKMVTTVNEKELKNLIKDEKITQEMVDKTISGNQSYRAYYGKIDK